MPSTTLPRLLVVDKEPAVHRLIMKVFEAEGMEVVCVEDAGAALTTARAGDIDVVLTNGYRRNYDCTDPLLALRTCFPRLPILSLESLRGPVPARLGDRSALFSPFTVERLVAAVRQTLSEARTA